MAARPDNPGLPTARAVLKAARATLTDAGAPSPEVDARLIIEHVLGANTLAHPGTRVLTPQEVADIEALVVRRAAREPLQWLVGSGFYGLDLLCRRGVLVPRPETEGLAELAITLTPPRGCLLDVGTGTGAVALAVRQERPDVTVLACDISPQAVALAAENAVRLRLPVTLFLSDLLKGVPSDVRPDVVTANLPYLPDGDRETMPAEVALDPPLALFGGPDGLSLARRLVAQAPSVLPPCGWLLLELDPRNVRALAAELSAAAWRGTSVRPDLAGRERFIVTQRR